MTVDECIAQYERALERERKPQPSREWLSDSLNPREGPQLLFWSCVFGLAFFFGVVILIGRFQS